MAERMNGRLGVSVTNLLNEPAHKIPPFCRSFFGNQIQSLQPYNSSVNEVLPPNRGGGGAVQAGILVIFLRVNCIVLALGNLPTPLFGEGPVLNQLK